MVQVKIGNTQKEESVPEFLCIYIKELDDGGFQSYQIGLTLKVLEATGMDNCNRLPTTAKVEAPLRTDANDYEAKRYWNNS